MRSYRIILEYTTVDELITPPDGWGWYDILDIGPQEALSIAEVAEIPTPAAHFEDLAILEQAV